MDRSTAYRVRRRFEEEGEEGLRDRPAGRPRGVAKVDLRAMVEARRLQENPELGEFRVQAALEQLGIHLSRRTVGRILATNRDAEGLEKPSRGRKEKREVPFAASFRHEYWTSDVRYVSHSIPETGQAYVVAVLENYSRAVLANAYLSRYDVSLSLGAKLESVTNTRLFASPYETGQPELFALSALGEGGWIKAMRLKGYAPRSPGRPKALQQVLFRYAEAL